MGNQGYNAQSARGQSDEPIAAGAPARPPGGYRAVIHLDEDGHDKHASVLRNVSNLIAELGGGKCSAGACEVELVAHGPGLKALTGESGVAAEIADLAERGVRLSACANTLAQRSLGEDALLPGVGVVPSGIAAVVRRQAEGWAYVRP